MRRWFKTLLTVSPMIGVACVAVSGCGSATSSSAAPPEPAPTTQSAPATQPASAAHTTPSAPTTQPALPTPETIGWQTYLPQPGSSCQISYELAGTGITGSFSLVTASSQLSEASGVAVSTDTQESEVDGVKSTSTQPLKYVLSAGQLQLPASAAGPSGAGEQPSSYAATGSLAALADFGLGSVGFESLRVSSSTDGTVVFRVRFQRIANINRTLGHGQPTTLLGVQMTYVSADVVGAPASVAPALAKLAKAFKPADLYLAPGHGLAYLSGSSYSDVTSSCSG